MMKKQQSNTTNNNIHQHHHNQLIRGKGRSNSIGASNEGASNWDAEEGQLLSYFFNGGVNEGGSNSNNNHSNNSNTNNNHPNLRPTLWEHPHSPLESEKCMNTNHINHASHHNPENNEPLSTTTATRDRCIPNMHPQSVPPTVRYYPECVSGTTAASTGINNNNTKSVDIIKDVPSTTLKTISILEAPSKENTASTTTSTSPKSKMLPPPPRFLFMAPVANAEESTIMIQQQHEMQVQHLEWLKTMNKRAANLQHVPPSIIPIPLPPQLLLQPAPAFTTLPLSPSINTATTTTKPPLIQPTTTINYNPIIPPPIPNTSLEQSSQSNKNETDDRRAKRLARNRESARQSRRRKKELLETLSAKVNHLQLKLDNEKRNQINSMVLDLQLQRHSCITNLNTSNDENMKRLMLQHIMGTSSSSKKEQVTIFQYEKLKTMVLPTSYHFLCWLFYSNTESFYLKAKEDAAKLHNSPRISSRQIGEKISNSFLEKEDCTENECPDSSATALSCESKETLSFWPLLCHELSISVDQEERFLTSHRKIQLQKKQQLLLRMAKTQSIVSQLKQVMIHTLYKTSQQSFLNVLDTDQSIRFLKWRLENKSKEKIFKTLLLRRNGNGCRNDENELFLTKGLGEDGMEKSLDELCRRLNEALNVGNGSSRSRDYNTD